MKSITTRTRLALVAGTLALAAVAAGANGQTFYPDDPIARIVDSQDASGVPGGAPGRQVLGRAAAPGIHRRDAEHAHQRRPVQRSAIRKDALEVPDRTPERDCPPLTPGGEPRRGRAPVVRDVDLPERRGGGRRRRGADRVRGQVVAVRQHARGGDADRREERRNGVDRAPTDLPSAAGTYIRVEIAANGGPESWTEPAHAYFRRDASGSTLVGFERVPGGHPPGSNSQRTN
jgi:hypothetical protein